MYIKDTSSAINIYTKTKPPLAVSSQSGFAFQTSAVTLERRPFSLLLQHLFQEFSVRQSHDTFVLGNQVCTFMLHVNTPSEASRSLLMDQTGRVSR